MTEVAEKLVREALQLDPVERAAVIEELLSSLDKPDPALDAKWAKEAEDRLSGFRAGEIEAIPANEVFAELSRG
jgi:putative addiction module component (TIGR02574 family)